MLRPATQCGGELLGVDVKRVAEGGRREVSSPRLTHFLQEPGGMVVVQDGIHEYIGSGLRCDAVMMQFRRLSEISCNPYWLRLDATGSMTRSRLTITRTGNPARSVNVGCRSKLRRVTCWPTWLAVSCRPWRVATITVPSGSSRLGATSSAPTPVKVENAAPARIRRQCHSTLSSRPACPAASVAGSRSRTSEEPSGRISRVHTSKTRRWP